MVVFDLSVPGKEFSATGMFLGRQNRPGRTERWRWGSFLHVRSENRGGWDGRTKVYLSGRNALATSCDHH